MHMFVKDMELKRMGIWEKVQVVEQKIEEENQNDNEQYEKWESRKTSINFHVLPEYA